MKDATALASHKEENNSVWWHYSFAVLIFFVAFSMSGRLFPRMFSDQECTAEQGMCTPGSCQCAAPKSKRELVTQDATTCYQCVENLCPAIAEGDVACASDACECKDPTWQRKDVGIPGAACWQCVHPSQEMTIRASAPSGGTPSMCFAADAEAGFPGGRFLPATTATACATFRYNGAKIALKPEMTRCLTWLLDEEHWGSVDCESGGNVSRFKLHVRPDSTEALCIGDKAKEVCVEASEYMCTQDSTQCTMGHCRCESSSWTRLEMTTLSGATCYTCLPPVQHCPVVQDECSESPCQCANPTQVMFRKAVGESGGASSCSWCAAPTPRSTTESLRASAGTAVTFLCCVFAGLIIGCGIRRIWWAPSEAPQSKAKSTKKGRGASQEWSEIWADRFAYGLESMYEALVESPAAAFHWAQPVLKRAKDTVFGALDTCDEALEPCYCAIDDVYDRCRDFIMSLWFKACAAGNIYPAYAATPDAHLGPFMRAATAAVRYEAPGREGFTPESVMDLHWDPLALGGASPTEVLGGGTVEIPKEWMHYVLSGAGAPRPAAPPAPSGIAATSAAQAKALKRLQQRKTQAATSSTAPEDVAQPDAAEVAVDESWIDDLEGASEKKDGKGSKKDRKKGKKPGKKGAHELKVSVLDEPVADEVEQEEEEEVDDDVEAAEAGKRGGVNSLLDTLLDQVHTGGAEVVAAEAVRGLFLAANMAGHEAVANGALAPAAQHEDAGSPEEEAEEAAEEPGRPRRHRGVQKRVQGQRQAGGERQERASPNMKEEEQAGGETQESVPPSMTEEEQEELAMQRNVERRQRELQEEADKARQRLHENERQLELFMREEAERKRLKEADKKKRLESEQLKTQEQGGDKKKQNEAEQRKKQEQEEEKKRQKELEQRKKQQQEQDEAEKRKTQKEQKEVEQRNKFEAEQRRRQDEEKKMQKERLSPMEVVEKKARAPRANAWNVAPRLKENNATISSTKGSAARWSAPNETEESNKDAGPEASSPVTSQLTADAPDFVPFALQAGSPASCGTDRKAKRAEEEETVAQQDEHFGSGEVSAQMAAAFASGIVFPEAMEMPTYTSIIITGIPAHHSADTFRQQVDTWGLMGTYNYFFMPHELEAGALLGGAFAVINFIDPTFAQLCVWLFMQNQFEGIAAPAPVQGVELCAAQWSQYDAGSEANEPIFFQMPVPSQWAVNGVNMMLNSRFSPQIREQFHKTKFCAFFRKNKCALARTCPFAHSKDELMPAPDLAKTKLCYNFFRRKCSDRRCKFAHGYQELRATSTVYKTEFCRWWSIGSCKAGASCRYAHGVEELRRTDQCYSYGMGGDMMSEDDGDAYHVTEAEGVWDAGSASGSASGRKNALKKGGRRGFERMTSFGEDEAQGDEACGSEAGSVDATISDMGFSDVWQNENIRRQQTAPAASASANFNSMLELPRHGDEDNIMLRVKSTFMEAVHLDLDAPSVPMRRSWSDGDLAQLSEVMDGLDGFLDDA